MPWYTHPLVQFAGVLLMVIAFLTAVCLILSIPEWHAYQHVTGSTITFGDYFWTSPKIVTVTH